MVLHSKTLFELPVYRLDQDCYFTEFISYKTKHSTPHYEFTIENFGGLWEYNEIIGFLKFYVSGKTQIRCNYSETEAKRKYKTTRKKFVLKNDSFCAISINKAMENEELIKVIKDCIEHCRGQLQPRWYIDETCINSTIEHTDWKAVIA